MSTETQTQISDESSSKETALVMTNADELAAPLVDGMPEPTNSGANTHPKVPNGSPANTDPINEFPNAKDSAGVSFDPKQHRIDTETGQPKLNKKGRFVGLNFGRPPGSKEGDAGTFGNSAEGKTAFQTVLPGESPPPVSSVKLPDEYELAARAYIETGTGMACVLISDEWKSTKEETEWLTNSCAAYLRAKGNVDLTPGQLFALAICAYSGKRAQMPKTQEKIQSLTKRIKSWFK